MHGSRIFLALVLAASAVQAAPRFVAGPYKHLAIGSDGSHIIKDAAGALYARAGQPALTWAFATGECGREVWGAESARDVARANVAAFAQAGIGYIVSTGGQGGVFTCSSDAGMARFVARYLSPQLLGLDFDIEAGQTAAQITSIVRRAKYAQHRWPQLRMSFTIATFAREDGSNKSLNATGEAIVAAIRRVGLKDYVLNLMVMDYGPAQAQDCVVREGRCDMGASAIQAARNVHAKYGVPFEQIALTPMIGVNDVVENVFTLDDAAQLAHAAREMKLAGLHFWSLDRDQPCASGVTGAQATCSTMQGVPAGAYIKALAETVK